MHYMLIANLHIVSKGYIYIMPNMINIMNNAELLRFLMIYIKIW